MAQPALQMLPAPQAVAGASLERAGLGASVQVAVLALVE
jgi:hypothetical protein